MKTNIKKIAAPIFCGILFVAQANAQGLNGFSIGGISLGSISLNNLTGYLAGQASGQLQNSIDSQLNAMGVAPNLASLTSGYTTANPSTYAAPASTSSQCADANARIAQVYAVKSAQIATPTGSPSSYTSDKFQALLQIPTSVDVLADVIYQKAASYLMNQLIQKGVALVNNGVNSLTSNIGGAAGNAINNAVGNIVQQQAGVIQQNGNAAIQVGSPSLHGSVNTVTIDQPVQPPQNANSVNGY